MIHQIEEFHRTQDEDQAKVNLKLCVGILKNLVNGKSKPSQRHLTVDCGRSVEAVLTVWSI